jgi:hypothetical protein
MIPMVSTSDVVTMLVVAAACGAVEGLVGQLMATLQLTPVPTSWTTLFTPPLGWIANPVVGAVAAVIALYFLAPITTTVTQQANGSRLRPHQAGRVVSGGGDGRNHLHRRGPSTDPRRRERAEGPDDGSRRPPVRWLLRRRREYRPVSKPLRRLSMRLPIPDPHDGADYTCAPCCRLACSWSRSATIPDLDPRSAHGRYSWLNGEQIPHRSAANRRGSPGFRLNADPFKRGPHVGEEHHPHWSAHAAGRSPRPLRS